MRQELRSRLHQSVLSRLDGRRTGIGPDGNAAPLRARAEEHLHQELARTSLEGPERGYLVREILDEIFAYGPLTPLLDDPSVSEIMVNGNDSIYLEREGRVYRHDGTFLSEESLRATIDRIVSRVNRRLDESSPYVDARLPDGSRVNAIIPPVSLTGPCLTIRKFRGMPYTLEELVRIGSLAPDAAEYLRDAVVRRRNIVVSGGTGSGKTTLLNALSRHIPDEERIITIEDAAEIRLQKPHVVRLEARPPNIEGNGAVTIRDLVRNSLRMRPDRIIVGECRGGEALDMLQAMNTGHDGSITTGHANTPRDMLRRLETMVLLSGVEIPIRAIREQVASGIDVIVHTARTGAGGRAVTSIVEVAGMNDAQILIQEIFRWEKRGEGSPPAGRLVATGVPSSLGKEGAAGWD
jgi:pilus assembly protein CpaF